MPPSRRRLFALAAPIMSLKDWIQAAVQLFVSLIALRGVLSATERTSRAADERRLKDQEAADRRRREDQDAADRRRIEDRETERSARLHKERADLYARHLSNVDNLRRAHHGWRLAEAAMAEPTSAFPQETLLRRCTDALNERSRAAQLHSESENHVAVIGAPKVREASNALMVAVFSETNFADISEAEYLRLRSITSDRILDMRLAAEADIND